MWWRSNGLMTNEWESGKTEARRRGTPKNTHFRVRKSLRLSLLIRLLFSYKDAHFFIRLHSFLSAFFFLKMCTQSSTTPKEYHNYVFSSVSLALLSLLLWTTRKLTLVVVVLLLIQLILFRFEGQPQNKDVVVVWPFTNFRMFSAKKEKLKRLSNLFLFYLILSD